MITTSADEECFWCGERGGPVRDIIFETPLQPEGEPLPTCEECETKLKLKGAIKAIVSVARKMTPEGHRRRHRVFHGLLDEMMADFINQTGKTPSDSTLMEFAEWSQKQTKKGE